MKAFLKFLVTAAGLVLIAIGVAAILIGLQLERALQTGLERTLSQVLRADVVVDAVKIRPLDRSVALEGVTIGNPDTFQQGSAFGCKRVTARLDARSLLSGAPAVSKLDIEGAVLNIRYEVGEGTNIRRLMENASRFLPDGELEVTRRVRRAFVVRELDCDGATANLSANILPVSSLELKVDPFILTHLGEGRPVSPAEVTRVLLGNLLDQSVSLKGLMRPAAQLLREELMSLRTGESEAKK